MDLRVTRDRTAVYVITVTDSVTGDPIDLSGKTLVFTVAPTPNGSIFFQKQSPDEGIVITDAAGGLATVTIDPEDTVGIPGSGNTRYAWDLAELDGDKVWPLNSGGFSISANVGQFA